MNLPNVKHSLSWAQAYGFKWHIIHAVAARDFLCRARNADENVKGVYLAAARRAADQARHSLNFAMGN
jgi:hypothetical protein